MNETTPFGKFQYFTFDEEDFNNFGKQYNYHGGSAGYYKKNVTASAHPESREWPIAVQQIYRKSGRAAIRNREPCKYNFTLLYN